MAEKKLTEVKDGKLILHFHPGQLKAWDSEKRFIFMLAGTQAGKTEFAVHWLYREMQKRGDGDYMVVSPSYPLQQKKVLPTYLAVFQDILQLGEYRVNDRIFYVNKKGLNSKIFFGSADNPDSLESATAKAAHLDEVGQKGFRIRSWEAVQRRLGIHEGRVLGTTTLYTLGWLKSEIYDRWKAGASDIDIIQFPSILNPAYPQREYERAKSVLPAWKFNMFYRGEFDRPAGMIYDAFNSEICKIPAFEIPDKWPRYVGHDFGGVNMAAIWVAEERLLSGSKYYVYRTYLKGGLSIREHAENFKQLSYNENIVARVGGSDSEEQYRRDFATAGWPISKPPIKDVEVGIDRIYGLHKENRIYVFDNLLDYLDEQESYSRQLDELGNPTEKIADKESYHLMDCARYVFLFITQNAGDWSGLVSSGKTRVEKIL